MMNYQMTKYNDYMAQEYNPVMFSEIPYLVDHRALRDFAKSKGVAIVDLSDEEKQQFMYPNPEYKKERKSSIAAAIL